jgi:bacterial/archaeal transporter family-2 protein
LIVLNRTLCPVSQEHLVDVAFFAPALLAGALLAVQASANLQLNSAVGTPYGASTLQLSLAAGLLLVLAVGTGTIGAVGMVSDVPPWQLLGGLASPLYITSGILLFPRIGALAAVALFVTGQMLASLGLDQLGLLGVADQSLTIGVSLGAAAVLAGITMIFRGQRPAGPRTRDSVDRTPATSGGPTTATLTKSRASAPAPAWLGRPGWVILGIAAGASLPVQGAVNAQLREGIHHSIAVALVSFTVAALTIAAVLVVLLAFKATPRPVLSPTIDMPWWGWLGGACAVVYVTATFMLIPVIGAATTVALTVTGQQLASAAIDSHGLFRMPRRSLTPRRLAGLALLISGSALVQLT